MRFPTKTLLCLFMVCACRAGAGGLVPTAGAPTAGAPTAEAPTAVPPTAASPTLSSPDGHLVITVHLGERLAWSLAANGRQVLAPSPVSLRLSDRELGLAPVLLRSSRRTASNYRREPESLAFIASVPTVWDETRSLGAAIGEYILLARRSGRDWFVGALTSWTPRDLELDLAFLGPGSFQAEIHRDGANADRVAVDYARELQKVGAGKRLRLHLAPGGGAALRIRPQ